MKNKKMTVVFSVIFVLFFLIVLDVTFIGFDRKMVFPESKCSSRELEFLGTTGSRGVYSMCISSVRFLGIRNKDRIIEEENLFVGNIKNFKEREDGTTYYRGLNYYVVNCRKIMNPNSKIIIVPVNQLETALHMC